MFGKIMTKPEFTNFKRTLKGVKIVVFTEILIKYF